MNVKNDHTKLQYRDEDGSNVLTIGKKEFFHIEHQTKFKESWVSNNNSYQLVIKLIRHPTHISFNNLTVN